MSVETATAPRDRSDRVWYSRHKPDAATVPIKVQGELFTLLRLETKVGSRALTLVVARMVMWGEARHAGGVFVRLDPQDFEVVLDALDTIAMRMAMVDEKNSRAQAKSTRSKIETIINGALRHGWDVARTGPEGHAAYRVSRLAPAKPSEVA